MEDGIHDVFEGPIPESAIGDYENTRNLSEFYIHGSMHRESNLIIVVS